MKRLPDETMEKRVAYEVSVSKLELPQAELERPDFHKDEERVAAPVSSTFPEKDEKEFF